MTRAPRSVLNKSGLSLARRFSQLSIALGWLTPSNYARKHAVSGHPEPQLEPDFSDSGWTLYGGRGMTMSGTETGSGHLFNVPN